MSLRTELKLFKNKLKKQPLSTTRRNSKKDLEDSLVVLQLSRLVDPQTSKSENLKIELKMLFALPELQVTKVSFQEEDLLFSTHQRDLTTLRVSTLTKTTESKLSRKHALSQLELFAKMLDLKDQLL